MRGIGQGGCDIHVSRKSYGARTFIPGGTSEVTNDRGVNLDIRFTISQKDTGRREEAREKETTTETGGVMRENDTQHGALPEELESQAGRSGEESKLLMVRPGTEESRDSTSYVRDAGDPSHDPRHGYFRYVRLTPALGVLVNLGRQEEGRGVIEG
ncbi:hypothetical protein NDU88_003485 [Pleurodeles waltl]|uniref:Uncharacterized protein n=1 Tax=Pleurodeles waltl TaxID=8319 RepID=A0AAV7VHJ9_PLEWA|nr:hypothetical protein NDU88_003485 [Pleurodeles waltl]